MLKSKIVQLLKRLLRWLEVPENVELFKRALELILSIDKLSTSGEHKRHQVYAQLIKEFPDVPKNKLGLVIEQVIDQEMK